MIRNSTIRGFTDRKKLNIAFLYAPHAEHIIVISNEGNIYRINLFESKAKVKDFDEKSITYSPVPVITADEVKATATVTVRESDPEHFEIVMKMHR